MLAIVVAMCAVQVVAHRWVTGLPWRDSLGRRPDRHARHGLLDYAVPRSGGGGLLAGLGIVGGAAGGNVPAPVLGGLACAVPFVVLVPVQWWGRAGRAARSRSDGPGERQRGRGSESTDRSVDGLRCRA